jgi:ATP-binding cassette subfamily B (MDR/TAP) protein 6
VPRRALILTLLSLIALTYLADGLSFVVYAVLDNNWPRHSGIPINTVTGLLAFSGLAALGAWKEILGVEVWLLRRVKGAIAAGLVLDLSLVVILALHLRQGPSRELPCTIVLILCLFTHLSQRHFFPSAP